MAHANRNALWLSLATPAILFLACLAALIAMQDNTKTTPASADHTEVQANQSGGPSAQPALVDRVPDVSLQGGLSPQPRADTKTGVESRSLRPTKQFFKLVEETKNQSADVRSASSETEDGVRRYEEAMAQRVADAGAETNFQMTINGTVSGPDGSALVGANIDTCWRVFFADNEEDYGRKCDRGQSTLTDLSGRFSLTLSISVLERQSVRLSTSARRRGLASKRWTGSITRGSEPPEIELKLGETGAIHCQVVGHDLAPVAGVTVKYEAPEEIDSREATTDTAGFFFLDDLPAEPCLFRLTLADGRKDTMVVCVRPNEVFHVTEPHKLSAPQCYLKLLDETGEPIVARALAEFAIGEDLEAMESRYGNHGCIELDTRIENWSSPSTNEGKLFFSLSMNGRWRVTVWAEGYQITETTEFDIDTSSPGKAYIVRLKREVTSGK